MNPDNASRYTLIDEGEFLRVRWAPGITISAGDVRTRIAATMAASSRGKRPLLVHIGLASRITSEAKQLLVDDTWSTRIAIVGLDEVGRVLTAFNHRSATPSRYFDDEADAIAWLTESFDDEVDVGLPGIHTAEVRGDVVWVQWHPNMSVIDSEAAALTERVAHVNPAGRLPMVVNLNPTVVLSQSALRLFATALNVTALAFIGADSDKTIVTHFRQVHRPSYPAAYFEAVDEALDWLSRYRP